MIINDAATGVGAEVDSLQRLAVLADSRSAAARHSLDGNAIVVHSSYSATAAQEILAFENSDPVPFYLSELLFTTDTAGSIELAVSAGTQAGTAATVQSLKLGAAIEHLYIAFGNASVTGLTPGNVLAQLSAISDGQARFDLGGVVILGNGQAVCITTNVSADVSVELFGYWSEA